MSDRISGTVTTVNEKGLKLDGGADWHNRSKWAEDLEWPPQRGDRVELILDKQGFIRAMKVLVGGNGNGNHAPGIGGRGDPNRERTITRLSVLKAAAEFAAGREEIKSGQVLEIARRWEAWVLAEPANQEIAEGWEE